MRARAVRAAGEQAGGQQDKRGDLAVVGQRPDRDVQVAEAAIGAFARAAAWSFSHPWQNTKQSVAECRRFRNVSYARDSRAGRRGSA